MHSICCSLDRACPLPPENPCVEGLVHILWSKWGSIENCSYVCERGGVDMYVFMWLHTCCGGQKSASDVFPFFFKSLFTLIFETGFHQPQTPPIGWNSWLMSPWDLSVSIYRDGIQTSAIYLARFLGVCWGSIFKSSCLHSQHLPL